MLAYRLTAYAAVAVVLLAGVQGWAQQEQAVQAEGCGTIIGGGHCPGEG